MRGSGIYWGDLSDTLSLSAGSRAKWRARALTLYASSCKRGRHCESSVAACWAAGGWRPPTEGGAVVRRARLEKGDGCCALYGSKYPEALGEHGWDESREWHGPVGRELGTAAPRAVCGSEARRGTESSLEVELRRMQKEKRPSAQRSLS